MVPGEVESEPARACHEFASRGHDGGVTIVAMRGLQREGKEGRP